MLNTTFWALVVLGVLIFVHELGHFLVARFFGVRVLIFSLGFGPKIFSWSDPKNGTEYRLSAVPLGGYVKMLGESDDDEEVELSVEDQKHAFSHQSVGPRFAIVSAGPIFNFIFALFALSVSYILGVEQQLPVIGSVSPNMPGAEVGLLAGDYVTQINDTPLELWDDLSQTIRDSNGEKLVLTVRRQGELHLISVTPRVTEVTNLFGEKVRQALIGITPGKDVRVIQYSPLQAIKMGLQQTWRMTHLTVTSIWKLLTRVVSADQIGGPLLIAELAGKTAAQGATNFLFFMSLISINLGVLNLLPIPVLDGGHLMFFSIEALKGSPVSEKAQWMANRVGMTMLILLMVWAMKNDLVRLLSGAP
ncbi:MAG: RIP metalloprotease RseP [Magnetococcus sp. DMHC-6]